MTTDTPTQPRLVVISAPSGAGKTTLCRMLLGAFPNIVLSVSATTRKKRPNERDNVHYQFLSQDEFNKLKEQDAFAEWAEVHGNLYGTLKSTINDGLAKGHHVLFDIDVQGAESLKKSYGDRALLIFICPPSMKELEKRLVARQGDSSAAIETRLQNAYDELEWSKKFHYRITNDNLERAFEELRGIIQKECL